MIPPRNRRLGGILLAVAALLALGTILYVASRS